MVQRIGGQHSGPGWSRSVNGYGLANTQPKRREYHKRQGFCGQLKVGSSHPVPTGAAETPADLAKIIAAWPRLSEAARRRILETVQSESAD